MTANDARRSVLASVAVWLLVTPASVAHAVAADERDVLRTFVLPKKTLAIAAAPEDARRTPDVPRPASSRLMMYAGAGYLQGGDAATEIGASGGIGDIRIDLSALASHSTRYSRLETARLTLAPSSGTWSIDAGDVFSLVTGPARGARLSWKAAGNRRPAVTISAPWNGARTGPLRASYRDQLRVGAGIVDGEIASDGSYLVAARAARGRVELDAAERLFLRVRDTSAGLSLVLWRGARVRGGVSQTRGAAGGRWMQASVYLPLSRAVDLTIERAQSVNGPSTLATTALMGSVHTSRAQFFHRVQWGTLAYVTDDVALLQSSEQLQSMASYGAGARLRLTLQMASQWAGAGRMQSREEVHASWTPLRDSRVDVSTPVARRFDASRTRVRVSQNLGRVWSASIEYGRLSPYQQVVTFGDRPRVRVMVRRSWAIATPPPKPTVTGVVRDQLGRPVAGARVRTGSDSAVSDAAGRYAIRTAVRPGDSVRVDRETLPAQYGWDEQPVVIASLRQTVDFNVAPLNSIAGNVALEDETTGARRGLAGVVIRLDGEMTTVTDAEGRYAFYNLRPGRHVVEIAPGVRTDIAEVGRAPLTIQLVADRAVTDADFRVRRVARPIRWSTGR